MNKSMSMWFWFWASAVPFVIAGCGGQSTSDGSGGSSGSGASSGSGGSGGNPSGGSGGTSGNGGTPGSGGAPCSALVTAYGETLAKAQACNPNVDINQCTAKVPDALACPCASTFVNAAAASELQILQELQAAWSAQQCGALINCPAVACAEPLFGQCVPDPVGGVS